MCRNGGRGQPACVGAGEGQMEDSQPRCVVWRRSLEGAGWEPTVKGRADSQSDGHFRTGEAPRWPCRVG